MKLVYLEIEGVNSFREKQHIDLERLTAGGIFGIFGPTGSGKSTVLDSILLALYGKMERSLRGCGFINVNGSAAAVTLVFEEGENPAVRYEVSRSFKRRRGGAEVTAALYRIEDGEKTLLCEGVDEVDAKIEEIVGFSYRDFARCVVMPQGEFTSFLREPHEEKVATVGRIFSLERYGKKLEEKISARAHEYDKELYAISAQQEALGDISRERIAEESGKLAEIRRELKQLQSAVKGMEDAVATSEELLKLRRELEAVDAALDRFSGSKQAVKSGMDSLVKARRAREVMPKLRSMLEAEREVEEMREQLEKLTADLNEKYEVEKRELAGADEIKQSFYTQVMSLTSRKDKLEMIKPDVQRLARLGEEGEELLRRHAELEEAVKLRVQEREELSGLLAKSEEYIDALSGEVAGAAISKEAVKALALARDIEVERGVLENQKQSAERDLENVKTRRVQLEERSKRLSQESAELNARLARADKKIRDVYYGDCSRTEALCLLANENVARHAAAEAAKLLNRSIAQLKAENAAAVEKIHTYADNGLKAVEIRNSAANERSYLEERLASKNYEREEYLGKNVFTLVANELQPGMACPLCGNPVEQAARDERVNLAPFDEEIKRIRDQVKAAAAKADEAESLRSELEARSDELRRQIDANKAEIERLKEERRRILAPYVDISPDDEDRMAQVLRLSDERVAKLEQLVNASLQLEKEIAAKSAALIRVSAEAEQLANRENELTETCGKLEARVAELNISYLKYEEILKGVPARNISDIILDNDGRKARAVLKLSEQKELRTACALHVKELDSEINELTIQLNTLADEGKAFERERVELVNRIAALVPEGSTVEEEQRVCQEKINEVLKKEQEYKTMFDELSRLIKLLENAVAERKALYKIKLSQFNALQKAGVESIAGSGFSNVDEIKESYLDDAAIAELEDSLGRIGKQQGELLAEKQRLEAKVAGFNLTAEELSKAKENLAAEKARGKELEERTVLQEAEIAALRGRRSAYTALKQRADAIGRMRQLLEKLDKQVGGSRLLEYIAADCIKNITAEASQTLARLTSGRYYLEYDREFLIVDNISGGVKRSVNSLSGGETFLVSLSLAMALGNAVMRLAAKPVGFFFLDEGFGTLDRELMESLIEGLDKFKDSSVRIGIISHVPELQQRISSKLILTPAGEKSGSRAELV